MKKCILLFNLVLLPLCGCSKLNIPSFERYSSAVSYETFFDAVKSNNIKDYFVFETSRQGKVKYGSEFSTSSKLSDVSIFEMSGTSESEISFSYDAPNKRSTLKEKGESSSTGTGAELDTQRVSKISTSIQFQYDSQLENYIYIDTKQKTFQKYDYENITDVVLYTIDDSFAVFYELLEQYPVSPDPIRDGYKFYIDGGVFTMVVITNETTDTPGPEEGQVLYTTTDSLNSLFQFEIKNGKLLYRSRITTSSASTYNDIFAGHLKDEVYSINETDYCSLDIAPGDLTIKEIDTSSYVSLDKESEGGAA